MGTQIRIDILHGAAFVQAADIDRAETAAVAVIEAAGTTPEAAHSEYKRQWLELGDEGPMTGLALVWIDAGRAADLALTEGWHNPEGAYCAIDR